MKKIFLFLLLLSMLHFSCKNTATPEVQKENTTEKAVPSTPKPATPSSPTNADSELTQDPPLTEYAKQFYGKGLWHYEAAVVVKAPEKGKIYYGKWVKLFPNNTMETGFYDGPVTNGSWSVDEAANLITILEDGERPTYSEWKIKTSSSSDDIMIWVGTKRFGLNNTQIKMMRYLDKPTK